MKKNLYTIFTSALLFLFVLLVPQTASAIACGDNAANGKCGAAGGCDDGWVCVDTFGPYAACEPSNGRCENRDEGRAEICGFTNATDGWCGESGGCSQGYMCNSTTQVCEPSRGCEHTSNTYNKQCYKSWQTVNTCGADGGCEFGYRCTSVPETYVSRTGFACMPDPAGRTDQCPGSPNQPAETLTCGQSSGNVNTTCNCAAGNPDNKPHTMGVGTSTTYCCGWAKNGSCLANDPATPLLCGQTTADSTATCSCTGAALAKNPNINPTTERNQLYCCGWVSSRNCASTNPKPTNPSDGGVGGPSDPTNPTNPADPSNPSNGGSTTGSTLDIFEGPNSEDFKLLNPIAQFSNKKDSFSSPGAIVSRILLFAFPIAGLILFAMIVWAGFQIIMGAASGGSKAIDAGKQRATTAIVGFILLFVAYWVMQIIETIFGITIL